MQPIDEFVDENNNDMINIPYLKPLLLSALTLVLSLNISSLSADEVYKWTDDKGMIHYSDIKPNDVNVKSVKVSGKKPSNSRASAIDKADTLDQKKQTQLEAKAQALQENTQARENDSQCQAIRDNVKKMQENSRVKVNDNGQLRYLTPEEIEEKKDSYVKMLEEHCK